MTKYIRTDKGLDKMTEAEYKVYQESKQPVKTYLDLRAEEYGTLDEQLEYIVEHGVEAFITKQKGIKIKYPRGDK